MRGSTLRGLLGVIAWIMIIAIGLHFWYVIALALVALYGRNALRDHRHYLATRPLRATWRYKPRNAAPAMRSKPQAHYSNRR